MRRIKNSCIFFIVLFILSFNISFLAAEETHTYSLKDIINLAEQQNPAYLSAQKDIDAMQYELSAVKKHLNPQLELTADHAVTSDKNKTEYSISLTQPVTAPGRKKYSIEKAQNKIKIAKYAKKWEKQKLNFNIKNTFYKILYFKQRQKICEEDIDSLKKILSLTKKQRSSTQIELAAAKLNAELLRAKSEKGNISTALAGLRISLNNLTGGQLGNNYKIRGTFKFFTDNYNLDLFIKQAKLSNPLFLKKNQELILKKTDVFLEKAGRISGFKAGVSYTNELDKKAFGAGLSFPLPLWDNNSAKISKAVSLKQKAEWQEKAYEKELAKSLKEAYENKNMLLKKKKLYEDILKQSEKAFRLASLLYHQQKIDIFGLLDSKKDYSKSRQKYYKTLFNLAAVSAELEELSGVKLQK